MRLFLLISESSLVIIVTITSILVVFFMSQRWLIHQHNMTVWIVDIWEKVGAIWFKGNDLLVVKQRIFIEIWTVKALGFFIGHIICRGLIHRITWSRVIGSLLVYKVMGLLKVWSIIDVGSSIMILLGSIVRGSFIIVDMRMIILVLITVRTILSIILCVIVNG